MPAKKLGHVAVEWAIWLYVYSIVCVKSSVLKYPSVCLEIKAFLTYCTGVGGQLSPSPHTSSTAKTS